MRGLSSRSSLPLSCLAGLLFGQIIARVPCQGEGLACNIDEAVGAYAVLIYAVLGPIIFAQRSASRETAELLPARRAC